MAVPLRGRFVRLRRAWCGSVVVSDDGVKVMRGLSIWCGAAAVLGLRPVRAWISGHQPVVQIGLSGFVKATPFRRLRSQLNRPDRRRKPTSLTSRGWNPVSHQSISNRLECAPSRAFGDNPVGILQRVGQALHRVAHPAPVSMSRSAKCSAQPSRAGSVHKARTVHHRAATRGAVERGGDLADRVRGATGISRRPR